MEQLDKVIEEIRKLMLESAEELVSKRKLDERKPARAAGDDAGAEAVKQRSRETTPRESLGSRWISTTLESS
jgi:hypothetical protein